jgi:hypothetical protein
MALTDARRCALCSRDVKTEQISDTLKIRCVVCGDYRISGTLYAILTQERFAAVRPYLTIYTRSTSENVLSDDLDRLPLLTENNYEALARSQMHQSVEQKLENLLRVLHERTDYPGEYVGFVLEEEYPLVGAVEVDEARFFLRHLINTNLVAGDINGKSFHITVDGWNRLTQTPAGGVPGTCFVAMSYASELSAAFDDGIRPAVTDDCGFRVIRVDRVEHNENINDKIIGDLRSAQFVVADFTDHRPGVYFEAGFALGLGRPVVWTCRASDFDNAHFDTRPYNHIVWQHPRDLREKLTARIRATIPSTPRLADPV